jgi:hypothetical protein
MVARRVSVQTMRKFCCERVVAVEARDGRVVITFEKIYLDASLNCALELAAMCATAASKIVKAKDKLDK